MLSGVLRRVPAVAVVLLAGAEAAMAAAPKPPYRTETWPKTRQLVWSSPGRGGKFASAAGWLEDGKPAGRGPDKATDLVLPEAKAPYVVRARRGNACRHLTIGKNAAIVAGHREGPFQAWGNVWVKEGGRVHFIDIVGAKHTYLRLDGGAFGGFRFTPKGLSDPWKQTCSAHIHHKMQVTKFKDGSVEFIGKMAAGDEFYLSRGRMILSGEFRWSGATAKGAFEIFDGATLEIQSGACLVPHRPTSSMGIFNVSVYKGGTLQAGSPERPLTRDAFIRLGFEGKSNSGRGGMYAAVGSKIKVYSADPAKARLVITAATHAGKPSAEGATKGIEVQLAGEMDLTGCATFFDGAT
jgi:hypothetical protein